MNHAGKLETFINVVEAGSFAGAARKQALSTAAISRQISSLEADLKAVLLHRTTRKIALTDIGEQYYREVKIALERLQQAEHAIRHSLDNCTGTLHITCNRYFADIFLIPHLPGFMKQHPKLKVYLELAERFPDLKQEKVDIIFGVSLEGGPDMVRCSIGKTHYIVCASPEYLEKNGIPEKPADLRHHSYITHAMRKMPQKLSFKNNQEIFLEPDLSLNDAQLMRTCALQGMGIVSLHDYLVKDDLETGRLVEILKPFQEPAQSLWLYWQQSPWLEPKIRHFVDYYRPFFDK